MKRGAWLQESHYRLGVAEYLDGIDLAGREGPFRQSIRPMQSSLGEPVHVHHQIARVLEVQPVAVFLRQQLREQPFARIDP